jgi:hypothetical protein
VIPDVEEFGAKLELGAFGEWRILQRRKIEIVDPWGTAEGPRGVADCPQRLIGERVRIEILIGNQLTGCTREAGAGTGSAAGLAWVLGGKRTAQVGLARQLEVETVFEFRRSPSVLEWATPNSS